MSLIVPGGLPQVDRQKNPILTSFRNMIRLESLMYDPDVSDAERPIFALKLLYGENIPLGADDPIAELIWFYHCGKVPEDKGGGAGGSSPRLYDFEVDAPYIYAGFLQAYNINLSASAGLTLHWWEFMALFLSLPENTAMGQRMAYRGMDTSELKGKQKSLYESKKKAFALPNQHTPAKSLAEMESARKQRLAKRFAEAEKQKKNGGESPWLMTEL